MSKPSRRLSCFTLISLLAMQCLAQEPLQILSLRPTSEHGCVALRIELEADEVLSGLRWIHNDGTLAFPKLLLMEAEADSMPNLNDTGLVLLELAGEELDWGEADFPQPIVSSTGRIYAVFVYPAGVATSGLGDGHGPGLGVRLHGSGPRFLISADGLEWVPFVKDYRLEVEPVILAAAKSGGAVVLSSLAAEVNYLGQRSDVADDSVIERHALHAPHPNPFNPRVTIHYDIAHPTTVSLQIFDLRGRLVSTLVRGNRPAGRHRVLWEGSDARGRTVASGVYLLRADLGGKEFHRRLTLVR